MLTPKEIIKSNDSHIELSTSAPRKAAKNNAISQFEQVMNAPLIKANSGGNVREAQQNQAKPQYLNPHKNPKPAGSGSQIQVSDHGSQHEATALAPQLMRLNPKQDRSAAEEKEPRENQKTELVPGKLSAQLEMPQKEQSEAVEKNTNSETNVSLGEHTAQIKGLQSEILEINTNSETDISLVSQTSRLKGSVNQTIDNKQSHLAAESGQIPASLAASDLKPIPDKLGTSDKNPNMQSLRTLNTSSSPLPNDKNKPVLVIKGLVNPILTQVIDSKVSAKEFNTALSDTKLNSLGKQRPETPKDIEAVHIPTQANSQLNNVPGNIILANIKTSEPINQQLHTLVSQLVERIQILVPNIATQDRVQLVLDKGQLKGTEITISLKNNQLTVTLIHSSQNAELLQHMRPELLERLQRMNTDQQVRVITTTHEQQAHGGQQEQGQQQESSQKSRIIHDWLEEQNDA
ncbi:type III secretion system needle length determinant [Shewanella psychropiezotolerans]|uniref:Type III secretion system needle length determinant n=1 Tax=Shewanella psychropiezotolerans TaxID=2593655 RepID=A0ABX5X4V1_9GAMM|nr:MULTISPECIES: type III secretion system needle length determinant [Shewanella]MPY25666.1 type III secretion system needle length determinant [Shewanella sp. YLB-07]QDO86363.1 type III secretion system needle length determinant [Shewanella psychropiezotolerans]